MSMNLAKLQKQLMRDLKRSPGKAAALGLLCLVALWFWAPLVAGWMGAGQKKPTATGEQTAQAVAPPVVPAAASTSVMNEAPWHKVVAWMQEDGRMRSAELAELATPPFTQQREDLVDPGEATKAVVKPPTESDVDVAQLGLKLSSTMLGPRRRVAVINGRPYAEGGDLQLGDDLVLHVTRVADRSVFLEYKGKRFELSLGK